MGTGPAACDGIQPNNRNIQNEADGGRKVSRESQQVNPAAIVTDGTLDWESNERVRQLASDRWREVNGGSALCPGSVGSGLQDGWFGPEESTQ